MDNLTWDEAIILEMRGALRGYQAAALDLFCQVAAIANVCAQQVDSDNADWEQDAETVVAVLRMAREAVGKYQPLIMR